ncbi:MAG: GNAT family N-acetyltransferase, partial [Acetobacteraceae bacterium]
CYQSGFDYAGAGGHEKPGLVCHHLAVERYRREGYEVYDFLGGLDRTKSSLGEEAAALVWLEGAPRASLRGMSLGGRRLFSGLRAVRWRRNGA